MTLSLLLTWLLLLAEALFGIFIIYLMVVSVAALIRGRHLRHLAPGALDAQSAPFIAVVIPAHNEEKVLGRLLDSLSAITYPADRFRVHLIADNCTDQTVAIATASGHVRVHERHDLAERGKGYALQWAFARLERSSEPWDAILVLDADSVVSPDVLDPLGRGLLAGARAMQTQNLVLNGADSPGTALRWLALALMNHVRPLGRNALGASSTLTGNGMCLSRDLLREHPWRAFGLAEDYEYYLHLVEHGQRVRYAPDARVRSVMPVSFEAMRTQDVRWESTRQGRGKLAVVRALAAAGLRSRDGARLEAIFELLTPPLSILLGLSILLLATGAGLWALAGAWLPFVLALGLGLCLGVYLVAPLFLLRPPHGLLRALLFAPAFAAWKLWVLLVLRHRSREWVPTQRASV
jgi:hypothetical protein